MKARGGGSGLQKSDLLETSAVENQTGDRKKTAEGRQKEGQLNYCPKPSGGVSPKRMIPPS